MAKGLEAEIDVSGVDGAGGVKKRLRREECGRKQKQQDGGQARRVHG